MQTEYIRKYRGQTDVRIGCGLQGIASTIYKLILHNCGYSTFYRVEEETSYSDDCLQSTYQFYCNEENAEEGRKVLWDVLRLLSNGGHFDGFPDSKTLVSGLQGVEDRSDGWNYYFSVAVMYSGDKDRNLSVDGICERFSSSLSVDGIINDEEFWLVVKGCRGVFRDLFIGAEGIEIDETLHKGTVSYRVYTPDVNAKKVYELYEAVRNSVAVCEMYTLLGVNTDVKIQNDDEYKSVRIYCSTGNKLIRSAEIIVRSLKDRR